VGIEFFYCQIYAMTIYTLFMYDMIYICYIYAAALAPAAGSGSVSCSRLAISGKCGRR
jgi:hypothetical protein